MNSFFKIRLVTLTMLITVSIFVSAQKIDWYSIDSGGGISSNIGNGITIIGVIGQVDTTRMTGGSISLSGGYLPLPVAPEEIFLDGFES